MFSRDNFSNRIFGNKIFSSRNLGTRKKNSQQNEFSNSSGFTLPEILTQSRFYVELTLQGSTQADAFFMECKGFKYSQDLIEFAEVFPQKINGQTIGEVIPTKIPGNYKVDNISLKRGLNTSKTLWEWIYDVQNRNWAQQYRDGSLTIYKQNAQVGARINFFQAWPVSYTLADFTVSGTELAFEELELACQRLERVQ